MRKVCKAHPNKRIKNFEEVSKGFTEEEAVAEAMRCLQCKNPECVKGCPAGIDIPSFIKAIQNRSFYVASQKIREQNSLPAICGRVCPQEHLCEASCVLARDGDPIAIGYLERFASDHHTNEQTTLATTLKPKKSSRKVAVVGSGPAGLTVAADLSRLGYSVTLFEALHEPGGVLLYGIPEFRLPNSIVRKEVEAIRRLGVEIKVNHVIGKSISLQELKEQFDSVFIGVGAGLPKLMSIPGEGLTGVYTANEYLTRANLMGGTKFPDYHTPLKRHKQTVVIGGGNVSIDAARVARRLGSKVTVLYRRSIEEIPARGEEVEHAKEEGIDFLMMTGVSRIIGEGNAESVECIQMMLGEIDLSGRRTPLPIEDSEFRVPCDSVIIAVGQTPNPILVNTTSLQRFKSGTLMVDDRMRTSERGVFAGGDIVSGEATVIKAISDGKKAAASIHEYLSGTMFRG